MSQLIGQNKFYSRLDTRGTEQTPYMGDKNDMLMEESGKDSSNFGKLFIMGSRRNWNKHLEANQNVHSQKCQIEVHLVHNNKNMVILKRSISYSGDFVS